MTAKWITPSYRATDLFACACLDDEIRADDARIVWDSTNEFINADGNSLGPSPCCPVCERQMEEVVEDDGGMSDYDERMHERRQMGFTNF